MSSRDIYPSVSGAAASWRQLEVVANNLANANTTGFKAQRVVFESDGSNSYGVLSDSYVRADVSESDFSDGSLQIDGQQSHFALQGRGFFAVQGPDGEELLVRSGAMRLDAERRLVTASGEPVLGQGGPIEVPEGEDILVSPDGTVRTGAGDEIDQLRIIDADDLEPMGGTRWRARGETRAAEGVQVIQGALEGSNADPLRSMTGLVEAGRYFEVYQKAMQTSDELDGQANDLARS